MERLTWVYCMLLCVCVCVRVCVCVCECVSDWGHGWLKCSVCDSDQEENVTIMPKENLITRTHTHLGIIMNHSNIHNKTRLHMQCFSPTISSHLHTNLYILMISHTNTNNYIDYIDDNIPYISHRPSIINVNIDFYLYCPLEAQSPSCRPRRL